MVTDSAYTHTGRLGRCRWGEGERLHNKRAELIISNLEDRWNESYWFFRRGQAGAYILTATGHFFLKYAPMARAHQQSEALVFRSLFFFPSCLPLWFVLPIIF
jgi:hypothetical protein